MLKVTHFWQIGQCVGSLQVLIGLANHASLHSLNSVLAVRPLICLPHWGVDPGEKNGVIARNCA